MSRPLLAPGSRRVWIDAAAYGAKLFGRGGKYPADVAGIVALQSQAQRLVSSDAIFVAMGDVFDAVLRDDRALVADVVGKRATVTARRVLGAEGPSRVLREALAACTRLPELARPLVLIVPSPRGWLARATALRAGAPDDDGVSLDDLDAVAVYLAEALRGVSSVPLDGIVLGDARSVPVTMEEREILAPLVNVARHYRWTVGVHLAPADVENPSGICDLDFVVDAASGAADISRHRSRGLLCAGGLPRDFWIDASMAIPEGHGQWFGTIPETAEPERVLSKVKALRTP